MLSTKLKNNSFKKGLYKIGQVKTYSGFLLSTSASGSLGCWYLRKYVKLIGTVTCIMCVTFETVSLCFHVINDKMLWPNKHIRDSKTPIKYRGFTV